MNNTDRHISIIVLIGLALAIFYMVNIDGWLMHDDEGTDFYEVWRLQLGETPGVDFAAEQQPLFLVAGSALVGLFGRSPLPLRLLATIQVLLSALFLSLSVRTLWGWRAAAFTLVTILLSGMVFEQARLFRPDPMMLAWEMAGLGAALLAVSKNKQRYWALAGFCYGLAVMWKLFGVLPVIGLVLYFIDWFLRAKARWRRVFVSGLYFAIPYVIVAIGFSALLYNQFGFYYGEIFQQHAGLGSDTTILEQLVNLLRAYLYLIVVNAAFVFIIPLWILNRPKKWSGQPELRLLLLLLVSPIVLIFFSRPLYVRYLIFLIPVLAVLLAWQLELMFRRLERDGTNIRFLVPITLIILMIFVAATTFPRLRSLLRTETGTLSLADYVASHTGFEDIVLSDYAGINFFAERASIYEASIIAGGRIDNEIITGSLLTDRIEEENIEMVLLHVEGGEPPPHQLVNLVDYEDFISYLNKEFTLLTVFDRTGQQIEIYERQ